MDNEVIEGNLETLCRFVNQRNKQICLNMGEFREESDQNHYNIDWPIDYTYLCNKHYKYIKRWMRERA